MTPPPSTTNIDDSTTLSTDYTVGGEPTMISARRKMHCSVNVSMTPDQVDYVDSVRGRTKTSVWIRHVIQRVYPDFPDMEEEGGGSTTAAGGTD